MPRGIVIYGAGGSGKTTLGKELAQRLNFKHIDVDDYFWCWEAEIPFTVIRPKEEIIERMMNDIAKYPNFIMSGWMGSITNSFRSLFDLAVFLTASTEIRIERLRKRKLAMFGERVLAGGDMYEGNQRFIKENEEYDTAEPPVLCLKRDEKWAAEAPCPVLRLDGSKVADLVEWIAEQYSLLIPIE